MDFIDSVLVRLADPAERTALFTADAMAAIATAAYDMDAMVVQPPFNPVFDQFEIGTFVAPAAVFDGFWNPQGAAQRTEVRVRAEGLAPASVVRVDAVWRGSIIARTVPMDSHITSVNMSWASLDIDAQIVADLGALPTDPGVLESERWDTPEKLDILWVGAGPTAFNIVNAKLIQPPGNFQLVI